MVYAPDLIWRRLQRAQASITEAKNRGKVRPADTAVYGRSHFETLFATRPDPWRYTSPYEQTKYEQTLALLPSGQITRALELACAEGHFTVQLAPRVGSLVAGDISQIALSRAADRCAGLENVRFAHLDLTKDPLPGRFELIVCSEVLYYCADKERLRAVARKLVDALEPGGYLLTAHANLVVDDPDHTGFDWDCPFGAKVIGEVLASTRPLRLVKELRTPLYRIQLFRRDAVDAFRSIAAPQRSSRVHRRHRCRPRSRRMSSGTVAALGTAVFRRPSSPIVSRSLCTTALRRPAPPP